MIPFEETRKEIVFAHMDTDGTQRMFAVERILKLLNEIEDSRIRQVLVPIELNFAKWMLRNRGIEAHRLLSLMDVTPLEPIIFCAEEDAENTHLLIDGSHRYVGAAINESTHIRAYILPRIIWEQYLIEAPPINMDHLLKSHSGLK